ncbi:MAG: ThiF family adenylyltransferase [Phycisphaerales bacterium]
MDLDRYHRQMLLPGVGEEGQRRLLASHAMLVGCGALGCVIADHLVRAGVGTITIVDRDVVELTNLQRQMLYDERDATEGLPKAEAARRRLVRINSSIAIHAVVADMAPDIAEAILRAPSPSLLVDGTDNFETRYLLNDLAVKHNLPFVYGGAVGTRGMQLTVIPGRTPCLRCVFPEPPQPGSTPTCDTAGVLAPAVGIVAACQATDAIKLMLGRADLIEPTLLEFDLWTTRRRRIDLSGHPRGGDCPCCGRRDFAYLDGRHASAAVMLCGRGATQIAPAAGANGQIVDLRALASRLSPHGTFGVTEYLLRGTLERERTPGGEAVSLTVFPDGRAIIRGAPTPEAARTIYARYVGV